MNICVRYFASIKDDMGMGTVNIQVEDNITAGNLFDQLTSDIQYNGTVLIAVNHEYVDCSYKLKDGDEVAYFPPVTGG
tara:strand:+ start:6671 stop:6904 length:234 start_codon:yes stop_codon:yes gene_type:complete